MFGFISKVIWPPSRDSSAYVSSVSFHQSESRMFGLSTELITGNLAIVKRFECYRFER